MQSVRKAALTELRCVSYRSDVSRERSEKSRYVM